MADCYCQECVENERRFSLRFWSVVFFVIGVGLLVVVFLVGR